MEQIKLNQTAPYQLIFALFPYPSGFFSKFTLSGAYSICRLLRSEVYSFQKPKSKNDDSRILHQIRAAELGVTGNPLAPLVPLVPLVPFVPLGLSLGSLLIFLRGLGLL